MQLSEKQNEFEALGIGIAVITYDSNETSKKFSDQHQITYPILQDIDARFVKALGILNEKYQPGHRMYGIPHPGIFLVDAKGTIHAKFAEDDYKERPSLDQILESVRLMNN